MAMVPPRISYVSSSQLWTLLPRHRVAVIDVRDEERIYDAHIAGSYHFPSDSFAQRMPNLLQTVRGKKDIVVFHCALSQVRGPSCARMFVDYLSQTKEAEGIKNVMILERGFNEWESSGKPTCRCTDIPCKHNHS
ncbi:rhodanese/Cell cycle control phosphatase superfamily protein [Wolffia australiana]